MTEYKVDAGAWARGSTVTISAPTSHANDGAHTVSYCSRDAAGNLETAKSVSVRIDTRAPATSATGVDTLWHNHFVTLTFKATDNSGGSGMSGGQAMTEYKVGSSIWTQGTTVTIQAPSSHANDGLHTVSYFSRDAAGNLETTKSCTVRIDTTGPTTAAKATSGRKGHAIVLRYEVRDALSPKATAVRIIIKNSHGKVVKSFACATKTIATWYSVKWTSKARGTFRYFVYAKDLAGNAQSSVGKAKITVR
jgi:hypothetical protein